MSAIVGQIRGGADQLASPDSRSRLFLVLSAVVSAGVLLAFFLNPHSDFQVFWAAGRALMEGVDPYDATAFRALQQAHGSDLIFHPFGYPLWLAVLFIPLAVLPITVAKALWVAISLLALWQTIRLFRGLFLSGNPRDARLAMLATLLFWPIPLGIGLGQFTAVALYLLVAAYASHRRGHLVQSGLFLALATSKPHLGALCIAGILGASLITRRWRTSIAFVLGVTFLTGLGLIFNRRWIGDWVQAAASDRLSDLVAPPFASVWKVATLSGLPYADLIALVLAVIGVGLLMALFLSSALKPEALTRAFVLALVITTLVLPYSLNYDLTLLLVPILYCLRYRAGSRWGRFATFSVVLPLPWLLLLLTLVREADRTFDVVLSLALLALVVRIRPWAQEQVRPLALRLGR